MQSFANRIKRIPWTLWLVVILCFALFRLLYLFSLRDGHHVDETWSYGFANSYYYPYIYGSMEEGEWENVGEWITGETFKDYITVSENQRFSFDSVIYNKQLDLGPALYALVLHFICSLFPGQFSWSYAFAVNLLFYIPTLFFVFLISFDFTKSKICGFASLLFYVFSGCGTANFLYLRVYHMFTFFTLVLFWLILRLAKEESSKKKLIYYVFLPVITWLGCLTHYYFLVLAFLFTVTGLIIQIFKKRLDDFLRLGYVMLLSVMSFFAFYPFALSMILPFTSSDKVAGGYSYPYSWNLMVANKYFFSGTLGFFLDIKVADIIMFVGTIIFVTLVCGLFFFLFRNDLWMKRFKNLFQSYARKMGTSCKHYLSEIDPMISCVLAATVVTLFVVPYSASLFGMGYIERYFFPVMSLFVVMYVSLFTKLLIKILRKKSSIYFIVCTIFLGILLLQCVMTNKYTEDFKFTGMRETELKEVLSGRDCFIYTNRLRDLVWLSAVLYESNNIYIDYYALSKDDAYELPKLNEDCLVVIIDNGFLSEEQNQTMSSSDDMVMIDLYLPSVYSTEKEYLKKIEDNSGLEYTCLDEFNTFLGNIKIYGSK